jgi:WD40 repeat protein
MSLVLADDPRYLGQFWASEPKLVGFDIHEGTGVYATKTQSGLVELWDLETRERIASRQTAPGLTNAMVRFTPDGARLLASGYRTGRVFGDTNLESESLILRVPNLELDREFLFPDGFAWPWGDPFTADSDQLALSIIGATPEAAGLYVLNLSDGTKKVHRLPENPPGATFLLNYSRATFSPDGQMVAAGATCMSVGAGQRTDIFRVDTLEVIHSIPAAACWALEFSPDGRYLLLGIVDGGQRVELYDTTNWAMIARFIDPERNAGGATFTPDGKFIAAEFGAAAKLQLLAVPGLEPIGAPFETLTQSAPATAFPAFFGTDSETLYSISPDGLVSHWTLGPFGLARRSLPGASEGVAAVSPDGQRVAVQHGAGHWTIWDVQSRRILASSTDPGVPRAPNVPPAWSADGRYLVTGHRPASCGEGLEGRCPASVMLWDTETGTPVGLPTDVAYRSPTAYSLAIAVSGSRVAIGGSGWILQIYSIEPQGLVHQASAEVGFGIQAISFVDAQTVLVEDGSGSASTWDLTSNPPTMVKRQPYGINALHRAVAGPDGTLYIAASGALRSYDKDEFAREGATVPRLTIVGVVYGGKADLRFSADGTRVAALRSDGTVGVWNTRTGDPIGTGFGGPGTLSATLTPDGQTLVLGTDHGVELWRLDHGLWAEKTCAAAGRNLTDAEWAKYFPGRDYQATCPNWPAKPNL